MREKCLACLVIFALVGCDAGRRQPPPPTGVGVHLFSNGEVSVDRGPALSATPFYNALLRKGQQAEVGGSTIGEILVTITAEPDATCGGLNDLLTECQRARFENFALQLDRSYPFRLPLAVPMGTWEPLRVRLAAEADGSLSAVKIEGRELESLQDLRNELIARYGDDRGPGSAHDRLPLEFMADDHLKFEELARAYQSTGYEAADGQWMTIVKHALPQPLLEEPEEAEEPSP